MRMLKIKKSMAHVHDTLMYRFHAKKKKKTNTMGLSACSTPGWQNYVLLKCTSHSMHTLGMEPVECLLYSSWFALI